MPMRFVEFVENAPAWILKIRLNNRLFVHFRDPSSDIARFRVADALLSSYEVFFAEDPDGKNFWKARAAREEGNRLFGAGNWNRALACYNDSLRLSPWPSADDGDSGNEGSDNLALAFGNRAAVFLKLGRHAECVRDVDAALANGCPRKNVRKLLLRKVVALTAAGRYQDAVDCLQNETVGLGVCKEGWHKTSKTSSADQGVKECLDLLEAAEKGLEKLGKGEVGQPRLSPRCPTIAEIRKKLDREYKLKNGPHDVFPAASSLVEFQYDPALGRHFVAGDDIAVGDVLVKESYFASALFPDSVATNCRACMMWTDAPIPCTRCSRAVFCSPQCASCEEAALHAKECPFLWLLLGSDNNRACCHVNLVTRTLLKKTPDEWRAFANRYPGSLDGEADEFQDIPKSKYLTEDYENVFCLLKRSGKCDPGFKILDSLCAVYVMKLLEKAFFKPGELNVELRDFLGGVAARHFANYSANTEQVFDWLIPTPSDGQTLKKVRVGECVHPTLELFNFSCDANLVTIHFGNTVVARAVRPIKRGEPLVRDGVVSYLIHEKRHRQAMIRLNYVYDCACRACEGDWPTQTDLVSGSVLTETFNLRCPACSEEYKARLRGVRDRESGVDACPGCGCPAVFLICGLNDLARAAERAETCPEVFAVAEKMNAVLRPPNSMLALVDACVVNLCFAEGNKRYIDGNGAAEA